jgi:hypothetical protein
MPRPLIRDLNVRVTRGQDTRIYVTMSPAEDISDWVGIGCSFREDPEYPRTEGADIAAARSGDLEFHSWTETVTSTDEVIVDDSVGTFYLRVPAADTLLLSAGTNRYVIDVWRTDSGSKWQVVEPVWVSVLDFAHEA